MYHDGLDGTPSPKSIPATRYQSPPMVDFRDPAEIAKSYREYIFTLLYRPLSAY